MNNYDQELSDICKVLMDSEAVRCDPEVIEELALSLYAYASQTHVRKFHVPAGYYVRVDFDKMAEALYNAGYRKVE